jgi:hypothetical protein
MKASSHPRQEARLAALRGYNILDTPREADFDEIVALASQICEAPISVVNLVDAERQWFKAEVGLGVRETPIETSICAHAILEEAFVEIPDTLQDQRMRGNALCDGEPGLRFYAGAQLQTPDGLPLGTLCVLDYKPRTLTPLQRNAIIVLGRQVMAQLDLRLALRLPQRRSRTRLDKLWQECKEEDRELGVQDVEQKRLDYKREPRRARRHGRQCKRGAIAPGCKGQVKQIRHTGVLEPLKCQRAGVHDGSQAKHRCRQVRENAERAAERCKHARDATLREARGNGEHDTGSRNENHDERGDEELY